MIVRLEITEKIQGAERNVLNRSFICHARPAMTPVCGST
jgi:hypothetical protein